MGIPSWFYFQTFLLLAIMATDVDDCRSQFLNIICNDDLSRIANIEVSLLSYILSVK